MNTVILVAAAILAAVGPVVHSGAPPSELLGLGVNLNPLATVMLCVDLGPNSTVTCRPFGRNPSCPPKPYRVCGAKAGNALGATEWDRFGAVVQFKVDQADGNCMFRAFLGIDISITSASGIQLAVDDFTLNRVMYSGQNVDTGVSAAFFNYKGTVPKADGSSVLKIYKLDTATSQYKLFGTITLNAQCAPLQSFFPGLNQSPP